MSSRCICVIDSGIGGLAVLKEITKVVPKCNYLYFSDSDNMPYGNKSKRALWRRMIEILTFLSQYKFDCLVLGCNTLSVNYVKEIEDFLGVKTFGVFPPIESCIIENDRSILLSTPLTAKKYSNVKGLEVVGLEKLAYDIEQNKFCLNNLRISFEKKFDGQKALILGCTHYFFAQKQIIDYFRPPIVYRGEVYTAKMVAKYISNLKTLDNNKRFEIKFIGKNANVNKNFWEKVVKNI